MGRRNVSSNEDVSFVDEYRYAREEQRVKEYYRQRAGLIKNPYRMHPSEVTRGHFLDARIYDPETEPGYQIPRWVALKNYKNWLQSVREQPGWEKFRRHRTNHTSHQVQVDPTSVIIQKNDQTQSQEEKVLRPSAGKNPTAQHFSTQPGAKSLLRLPAGAGLTALPVEKGMRPDDENYRTKMFTEKMGRKIAQLRGMQGLSQAELAKILNIDTPTMRDIEKGGLILFHPNDVVVKKMAKILDVSSIKYEE